MARHVNSQYTMFKRNLQNRFAERYRENKNIEYSEQDKKHLKLITPDIPEPIIPKMHKFKQFSRKKVESEKTQVLSNFEIEYKEFVAKLREAKNNKENIKSKEETTITNTEQPTIKPSVVENKQVSITDTNNKLDFEKEYDEFIASLRKNKEEKDLQESIVTSIETNNINDEPKPISETPIQKTFRRHYRQTAAAQDISESHP